MILRNIKYYLFLSIFLFVCSACKDTLFTPEFKIETSNLNLSSNHLYINNNTLKVGVNLNWGGAIDYISYKGGPNIVERGLPDPGRAIQVSLYDGHDYYEPGANWYGEWGWNPVQAGDRNGRVSGYISYDRFRNIVYVKSRPLEWNGTGPSDIFIEEWISFLSQYPNVIQLSYKITHFGNDHHAGTWQELPCIYLKPTLNIPQVVVYQGAAPWTNDKKGIKRFTQAINIPEKIYSSENWVALIDELNESGVIVYSKSEFKTSFALENRRSGAPALPINLIGVHSWFSIPSGFDYQTDVYLIFGNWKEARRIIYELNAIPYSQTMSLTKNNNDEFNIIDDLEISPKNNFIKTPIPVKKHQKEAKIKKRENK